MIIIKSTETFNFKHNGSEAYDLGDTPVEISDEAYAHLIATFGENWFTIINGNKPEQVNEEGKTEEKVDKKKAKK